MSEFVDRLLILVIAAVTLGSVLIGWVGGYIVPQFTGIGENVGMAVLAGLFVVGLVAVWFEFNRIDAERV